MEDTLPQSSDEQSQPIGGATPPLTYEETPILQPVVETSPIQAPPLDVNHPPELPDPLRQPELQSHYDDQPKNSRGGLLKKIIAVVILFAVGLGGSIVIRQFLAGINSLTGGAPEAPQEEIVTQESVTNDTIDPFVEWTTYEVLSGTTQEAVENVTYKLPADVLGPICDGTNCASQGTYLPGGSRFTVAARGLGQLLADYRGKAITDVAGRAFETTETTLSGKPAIEFTGNFVGTTAGGYAFSRMRGIMIEVTDTLSLEVNHFTPNGLTADFEADEALFEQILKTVSLGATSVRMEVESTPSSEVNQ